MDDITVISCSTTTAICYNTSADYNVTTDDEIYIRALLTIPEAQQPLLLATAMNRFLLAIL